MTNLIRTLCPACQAKAAEQLADGIPIENDLGVLDVFCPHALVGAEILIYAGLVVDWSVRPFRDLAQFERFNATQKELRPAMIRNALASAATAGAGAPKH